MGVKDTQPDYYVHVYDTSAGDLVPQWVDTRPHKGKRTCSISRGLKTTA
jgi:hypothetical protein